MADSPNITTPPVVRMLLEHGGRSVTTSFERADAQALAALCGRLTYDAVRSVTDSAVVADQACHALQILGMAMADVGLCRGEGR